MSRKSHGKTNIKDGSTGFHKSRIPEAFEHECDVFCDKPLALPRRDTDEIIAAMNKSGRKLMVYQPPRRRGQMDAGGGLPRHA
ncbi:MAG: Gfo/Idh/MocA family oxidoreductase [Victivallaceae bacterium]|jgi:predicted dehydrogenase